MIKIRIIINYYITNNDSNQSKPLLIYLDGSGAFPLFQMINQEMGSSVAINYYKLMKDYRIVLISKPGVSFLDTVTITPDGFPNYKTPETYSEQLSLECRVNTTSLIIDQLVQLTNIDTSKIVLLGFSEGAQVAPFVATKNKLISHLILFSGNGLNQFFDPIITARLKSRMGQITEKEAQEEIDSLFQVYNEIYEHPKNIDKDWWGHTYKRWSSFTMRDPLSELLKLKIPIYIANGSLDDNSVLSADYIQLEFIRKRKRNLTYKTYPNYDHQFNELVIENNQFKNAIPKLDEVIDMVKQNE